MHNVVPADPQQSIEIHTNGDDRREVETIEGIDERRNLAAARGRGQHLQQQRRPPGRWRSGNFRELPARKSPVKPGIEPGYRRRGDACRGDACVAPTGECPIELARAERGFEDGSSGVRHIFALCSPRTIYSIQPGDQEAKIIQL